MLVQYICVICHFCLFLYGVGAVDSGTEIFCVFYSNDFVPYS